MTPTFFVFKFVDNTSEYGKGAQHDLIGSFAIGLIPTLIQIIHRQCHLVEKHIGQLQYTLKVSLHYSFLHPKEFQEITCIISLLIHSLFQEDPPALGRHTTLELSSEDIFEWLRIL